MEKQLDEPEDVTNESPSMSEPVEVQDAAASTLATPFVQPIIAAFKSKAQKQREYRQRIAASRTPAQAAAARKSKTERQRNNRLRKAANLAKASGSLEAKTTSSSITAAPKSRAQIQREYRQRIAASKTPAQVAAAREARNVRDRNYRLLQAANLVIASGSLEATTTSSSQRQLTDEQRQTLATEPAETTAQPSTSSDQIEVQAQSTCNTKWASSIMRFKSNFLDNDFGYARSVCDRLWFRNDLKPITAAQLKEKIRALKSVELPKTLNVISDGTESSCSFDLYDKFALLVAKKIRSIHSSSTKYRLMNAIQVLVDKVCAKSEHDAIDSSMQQTIPVPNDEPDKVKQPKISVHDMHITIDAKPATSSFLQKNTKKTYAKKRKVTKLSEANPTSETKAKVPAETTVPTEFISLDVKAEPGTSSDDEEPKPFIDILEIKGEKIQDMCEGADSSMGVPYLTSFLCCMSLKLGSQLTSIMHLLFAGTAVVCSSIMASEARGYAGSAEDADGVYSRAYYTALGVALVSAAHVAIAAVLVYGVYWRKPVFLRVWVVVMLCLLGAALLSLLVTAAVCGLGASGSDIFVGFIQALLAFAFIAYCILCVYSYYLMLRSAEDMDRPNKTDY